ncbi:MAG TPA: LytTR family DNA-binding domain-containing protein [Casimicrobium sp.]|jgi:DNA-binding LytR/AlgR family response regulator|nr:LytTR family DNA-binding domain-containing protein [Casimicrobium sp.]
MSDIGPRRISALIAEDEALFRDALISMLHEQWPELDVVAICEDGAAALDAIDEHRIDVAFLDIRMPGVSGLDVAKAMTELRPATQVVFVTAYDQYAIDAFEKRVVDYLLKPVSQERLATTIARLKPHFPTTSNADNVARMHETWQQHDAIFALAKQLSATLTAPAHPEPLVWLTASSGRETRLIMIDDVVYFQSDSKYTVVMTADGESMLRTPLSDIIARLDMNAFRQIHRGTVVNMRAVASITRDDAGRGKMRLKSRPETLTVSLTYMPLFKNM